ncbi:MAG: Wzt carbohydrate-binding domain-containing protein, partial [Paludibacteraceae bacterium]|nr:Wzt carbohydrate-binding domain-containing protein [Paludibacteraceae bacterium]
IGAVWHKDVLEDKPVQLIHAEVQNAKGEITTKLSCDEDFYIELIYDVREKVPGIYGYFAIDRARDQVRVFQSDSNDMISNKFETLPLGKSKVRMHFPNRMLAPGEYIVNLSLASPFNIGGTRIDWTYGVLKFDLSDILTKRGNNRHGFFSTIVDWEFVKE